MFNEIGYGSTQLGSTPECAAIKANCETRFPPNDEDLDAPETELWYQCMKATGYYDKGKGCFESTGYSPGSTFDALTNSDNPDYVWSGLPSLSDVASSPITMVALVAGALVVFAAMRR